jgi:hypothetical protein
MSTLLAFDLDSVTRQHIRDGIDVAPFYQQFSAAVKHVIRSIHAIPSLFRGVVRGEIEVYLGRAGGTEDHVAGRFRTHHHDKDHEHGVVLFEGATSDVISWEGSANRILRGLERRGLLCVANILAGENGPTPSTSRSVVYMTWKEIVRTRVGTARVSDIDEIADEVAASVHEVRPAKQIATALAPIVRPNSELADLDWHDDHQR